MRPRCRHSDGEVTCDGVRVPCAAERERGTEGNLSVLLGR